MGLGSGASLPTKAQLRQQDRVNRKLGVGGARLGISLRRYDQKLAALSPAEYEKHIATRPPILAPSERPRETRWESEQIGPMADPSVTLASHAEHKTVRRIYNRLEAHAQRELAVPPGLLTGRIAVLRGGQHDFPTAAAHANGSIHLSSGDLLRSWVVGRLASGSRTPAELLDHVWREVTGPGETLHLGDASARRHERAATAFLVGHELTHVLTGDVKQRDPSDPFVFASSQRQNEWRADAGGVDLAIRAGHSPLGMGIFKLYYALEEAALGVRGQRAEDTHPTNMARYKAVYEQLANTRDAKRAVVDARGGVAAGRDYMTPEMKREFDRLPTPAQVKSVARHIHKTGKMIHKLGKMMDRLPDPSSL